MGLKFKRELGNGRWDRVLKEQLTFLSEADNYDDAKLEWEATGECWWWNGEEDATIPEWVRDYGYCLCGHSIVYHFAIRNTITGLTMAVGSDHINSYLILKEIEKNSGIDRQFITDAMIEEWISVRIEGMKNVAWWSKHGEDFVEKFTAVRELDLRLNVTNNYRGSKLRKRANKEGMASIVWRWNHPENRRPQINGRGYPNKSLLADLDYFYRFVGGATINGRSFTEEEYTGYRKSLEDKRTKWSTSEMLEWYGFSDKGYLQNWEFLSPAEKNFIRKLHDSYLMAHRNSNYMSLSADDIHTIKRFIESPDEWLIQKAKELNMENSDIERFSKLQLGRAIAIEQAKQGRESDRLNSGRTWEK